MPAARRQFYLHDATPADRKGKAVAYRRLCFLVTPAPRVANAQNLVRKFLRNVTPDTVLLVYIQLDISPLDSCRGRQNNGV